MTLALFTDNFTMEKQADDNTAASSEVQVESAAPWHAPLPHVQQRITYYGDVSGLGRTQQRDSASPPQWCIGNADEALGECIVLATTMTTEPSVVPSYRVVMVDDCVPMLGSVRDLHLSFVRRRPFPACPEESGRDNRRRDVEIMEHASRDWEQCLTLVEKSLEEAGIGKAYC